MQDKAARGYAGEICWRLLNMQRLSLPNLDIHELWVTESWDTQGFSYFLDMSLQSSLGSLVIFEKSVLNYMHNGIIIEL